MFLKAIGQHHRGIQRGFLLLMPEGNRTLIGMHYLFRRFSYSSRESTRRKLVGLQNERTGPLKCGHLRGLFLALCVSGATCK